MVAVQLLPTMTKTGLRSSTARANLLLHLYCYVVAVQLLPTMTKTGLRSSTATVYAVQLYPKGHNYSTNRTAWSYCCESAVWLYQGKSVQISRNEINHVNKT